MAEQREPKLVDEVEVYAKALQQWTGFDPWIDDGRGE
jgi:hypothetical protein